MCYFTTSRMGSNSMKLGMINSEVAKTGCGLEPVRSKTDPEFGIELNPVADGFYDKLVNTA